MASNYPPSSSRPNTQPAPAVHPPLLPLIVTRPDAALPPMYDESWQSVQKAEEFLPVAFRKDKGAFRGYVQANIVLDPGWFDDLESKRKAAKDVLWPKTEFVPGGPASRSLHWSLRLLRYQVRVDKRTFEVSMFAAMIVFETIFVVLTSDPGSWPDGLNTLERLTNRPPTDINAWFRRRRGKESQRQSNLEGDPLTVTTNQVIVTRRGNLRKVAIRKDAQDYINLQVQGMCWDDYALEYCLTDLLKLLADRRGRLPRYCTLTLNHSHLHGIYIGPLDRWFGTEWSDDPRVELWDIQTHRLPQINNVRQLKFPSPLAVTYRTPRDPRFRIFLFNDEDAVNDYLTSWEKGWILPSSKYWVQAYDAEQHD